MGKQPRLATILDEIVTYDSDGDEWTLQDLNGDASWDIERAVVKYLLSMKVPQKKPSFGDTSSIQAATRNSIIDELIMIVEEGSDE